MKEYKILKITELKGSNIREIRENIKDELKQNIEQNGYYEARVLSVIKEDGVYLVADGNHRLQALRELGVKEVPCLIYEDKDLYKLAIEGNNAENTYAPMDLFDWLSIIRQLKEQGLTLKEIGEKIGWSESKLKNHSIILNKIVTPFLEFMKEYQKGRVTIKDTNVTYNFTEGWLREIKNLEGKYQQMILQSFIADKCKWSKQKLQTETARYKQWQGFTEICESELMDIDNLDSMIELIENNTFKTKQQLQSKIEDYNKEAKNKLICGDAIQELEKLEDISIDIVISDPPYGVDYISNRSQFKDSVAKKGVKNDDNKAFELLEQACEILVRKTKPNAHIYICCSWKVEPEFRYIISNHFEIKNVIIWDKGNHGAGDLEGNWADRYEMIIFSKKGNRPMTKRKANIIPVAKISLSKLRHPTEKPVQLLKELLEASAQPNDTVCDPFMGAGSTIKACVEFGNLNYIGIELDKEIFETAKSFIGE